MYKTTISLVAVLFLGGCYPMIEKKRPNIQVIVTDEDNQFIDGALVELATTIWQGKSITNYELKYSEQGKVNFQNRKHLVLSDMGLPKRITWGICVSKAGYQKQYQSVKGDSQLVFKLSQSEQESECNQGRLDRAKGMRHANSIKVED